MQIIKSFIKLFVFICPLSAAAQSTYLPQGDKGYQLVDRLEIKQGTNTDLNYSTLKPLSRRFIVRQAEYLDSVRKAADSAGVEGSGHPKLTRIDEYNLNSFYMNNTEWVTGSKENFTSRKPILKTFYKNKANLVEINSKDFFLAINPMLNLQAGKTNGSDALMFVNSRGVSARGMIGKKIGFYTSITDNQERGPLFFRQRVADYKAVPGNGFYKSFKATGQDYFDGRGYITFNAAKYIDIQFGYDKNFIGNGNRSLFLSDWGNSYLFLKLNTKIWKFNYQNIFMELMPQFGRAGDTLLDKKYSAMHHLSINLTKWLNVGLFEGIVFGRKNHFEFQYLNPIIFYRHIEGTIGSPDNALAGLDFKANVAHSFQFYGQFLLDEFKLDQIKANTGWWANKWGLQLGLKYIDAFKIPNLDLQIESNTVRPFTYSHYNMVANYTHYNQPLAHPLGSNFQELIGILRYQPAPRWYVNAKGIYYKQGLDSLNGRNVGFNIFRDNVSRMGDYGYAQGGGRAASCFNAFFQVSYEVRENLYLDLSSQFRRYTVDKNTTNASLLTAGVRWNMARREYDF
ncbi:MAG: capsule assembly Wzi family protein [Ferruginibacter sp.]|nr:capsule assembly Wzi family protein [Ferruginibacter sp.]